MNSIRGNGDKKAKKSDIFTKETFGVVLILFATLVLICLITRDAIFSLPGMYVNSFVLGVFGYTAYPITILVVVEGVSMLTGKKGSMPRGRKLLLTAMFVLLALIVHTATMHSYGSLNYGDYLSKSYKMAEGGIKTCSGGGLLFGVFAYLFSAILTSVGCYVVFGALFCLCGYLLVKGIRNGEPSTSKRSTGFRSSYVKEAEITPTINEAGLPVMEYPVGDVQFDAVQNAVPSKQKLFVSNPDDFAFKTKKDIKKETIAPTSMKIEFQDGGLGVVSTGTTYSKSFGDDIQKKLDYIKTPAQINVEDTLKNSYYTKPSPTISVSQPIQSQPKTEERVIPMFEHDNSIADDSAKSHAEDFANRFVMSEDFTPSVVDNDEVSSQTVSEEPSYETDVFNYSYAEPTDAPIIEEEETAYNIPIIEEPEEIIADEPIEPETPSFSRGDRGRGLIFEDAKEDVVEEKPLSPSFTSRVDSDGNFGSRRRFSLEPEEIVVSEPVEENKPPKEIPPINREYYRPPLDLLETYTVPVDIPPENHEERKEIIQHTLEEFHINAIPQNHIQGPAITRYEIMMPSGIPVKRVLNYSADLKMRLASREEVRIEAPIPGKNLVGVEVANRVKVTVGLKEVLEGMAGQSIKPNALQFALGKDLVGNSISDNLAKGPHYLVAGATGSGKSVCLNVMIVSLIMRYSPEELRLILVDPKRVEFRIYEHIPHLMIDEIITEPKKALAVLSWAQEEMERRYKIFEDCGGMIVDIDSYNENIACATVPKLPRLVIIIDELADLMETCKKDLEAKIQSIAQKARSAGIHLVLATQRPSVNIITGTIKANLPSRIAFRVMNFTDSQTILGEQGAEKLLGNGDMLYKNSVMPSVERYQGAYISSREVNNIVSYIKEKNKAYFDDELKEYLEKSVATPETTTAVGGDGEVADGPENDEFFLKVLAHAVNSGMVSISQLQRRFQIGWTRAGGLVDKMERMGFISGNEGSKARKVLLTREGYEQRFGPMPDTY